MAFYLVTYNEIIENIIVADDLATAELVSPGKVCVEINEPPAEPPMGKKYINGEYVVVQSEPTVEI